MLIGSHHTPPPALIVEWYRYPDGSCSGYPVRYIVELPKKCATTQEWLEDIKREDAGRSLVTGVAAAVDDEPTH